MRLAVFVSLTLAASPVLAADPPVIRSASGGRWSDTATWAGGQVPGAGSRVLIRDGHRVEYDVKSDAVVRGLNIAGTLAFATDRDTLLNVGLIKIQPGDAYSEDGFDCDEHAMPGGGGATLARPELLVGTPDAPVASGKSAVIRLHYVPGMNKETCPAIVCCGGRMEMHGQPLSRTWLKLGAAAKVGDTAVTLAESVTGWKVGDRVIVTGTQAHGPAKTESLTEERTITALDGTTLTLDTPLKMAHAGTGDHRGEVANLSRNVVVESADPAGVRGHTMYHKGSAGSLTYAEFRHLGKKNILGKYAIHFHLCRDTMRGSSVVGNSIWDSDNRWLTIHGTDYLVARDNVGYKSIGHGFFLEDGTEVYNVLDRNLAIGARAGKRLPKQVLPFDANEGAGFWWTCSLNAFTRNVAAECDQYGFRFEATPTSALKLSFPIRRADGTRKETDPRTLPFVRFEDNEVHTSHGLYGVNLGEGVNRVGPDARHPFVVKNLKIWDVHYGFRPQVPNLRVENLTLHRVAYGVYHPNYDAHYYKNVLISQTNTEPFNRGHDDLSVQYGLLVVDVLTFDGCRSGGMPLIQISDDNPTGAGETHLRNVKTVNWSDTSREKAVVNLGGGPRPQPKFAKGVPVYLHDWFGPGRAALVVSIRSPEFKTEPTRFRKEAPLTGDESRVAEVTGIPFPQPPEVVDDLPPATVVTRVVRSNGKLTVRGTTVDDGQVRHVRVNGQEAKATAANFAEWEVTLDAPSGPVQLAAVSEDVAGNVEQTPMRVTVK
ncbi:G8 domain-containing protein [Fimbriiglobus ruber]|uniref:Polycystic kidney and hepatic disease 1 n=1 Tax=Fimbriiglobus ruber TaxID=1908690 RepID=A0A225D443_9BACT|nr:G8 domain-containing protein [Fimbriiglobus ruber]OWK36371.1 Polycystic kidney and hepatic disease 1 precursor [Fimbriiglobus ruber]